MWRNRNFFDENAAKNKTGIGVPDTGFLCERLFQPAKIYMIQILDIFACETFGKTNWTPLFVVYALASGDHICPVNASFDADFGLAEHLNRGTGDWNVNCHVRVTSFMILQPAASFGGGFVACMELFYC